MTSKYKSGFEGTIADTFKKNKVRVKYEPYKLKYMLKPKGGFCTFCRDAKQPHAVYVEHDYIPDWVSEDDKIIVESKGKFTSAMRTKMLAVIQSHPDKDVRILFMRDNWLTRKKLEKYSDWAKKHNIPYAIGELPKEWIKDFKKHQIGEKRERKKSKTIAEAAKNN